MDEGAERPGLFAKGGIGRFLLALTVGATLLFAGACGGFIALMAGLEHFLPKTDDEAIVSAKNEGAEFASGHTVTECVTEAQARGVARCDAFAPSCSRAVAAFARACVSSAAEDGYCATMPKLTGHDAFSNLHDLDAILEWQHAACTAFPQRSWCAETMGEVLSACRERQRTDMTDGAAPVDEISVGSGASP
jgi:hypothetical protein